MNETWHIPRASLSGSSASGGSSNSSNKSHSNPSTVNRHSQYIRQVGHANLGYTSNYDRNSQLERDVSRYPRGSSSDLHHYHSSIPSSSSRLHKPNDIPSTSSANVNGGNKRGSRSSQGSTDSNSSTHSAASGSLLLTTANLERFAAIHKKNPLAGSDVRESRQNYNTNIIGGVAGDATGAQLKGEQMPSNTDAIITIDPNLHFVKTKDVDSVSIASSTHFTMVNGIGPPRKTKSGICSRGHQITVLILSMSTIFLVGILAAIYLLEMRARGMPQ